VGFSTNEVTRFSESIETIPKGFWIFPVTKVKRGTGLQMLLKKFSIIHIDERIAEQTMAVSKKMFLRNNSLEHAGAISSIGDYVFQTGLKVAAKCSTASERYPVPKINFQIPEKENDPKSS